MWQMASPSGYRHLQDAQRPVVLVAGYRAGAMFCRVVELKAGVPGHVVMVCYEMSS